MTCLLLHPLLEVDDDDGAGGEEAGSREGELGGARHDGRIVGVSIGLLSNLSVGLRACAVLSGPWC